VVPVQADQPPPWAAKGNIRDYRWIPAVGVLLLIVVVGWSLRGLFTAGASRTPPAFPTPTPTPAGLEFGRAYLFWHKSALPAVSDMSRSVTAINSRCKSTRLTAPCQAALAVTDHKLLTAITIISQGDIPACITTDLTRFKGDLEQMEGGLAIALNGYKNGDRPMVAQGITQFRDSARPLGADAAKVTKDVTTLCN
jgi:hypothetical protein